MVRAPVRSSEGASEKPVSLVVPAVPITPFIVTEQPTAEPPRSTTAKLAL